MQEGKARAQSPSLRTIGDVAAKFGVSLRTLRYYEEKGFVKPTRVGRTRYYTLNDENKIGTILKGKMCGLTLSEIKKLIAGNLSGGADLFLRQDEIIVKLAQLAKQREKIERAISELQQLLKRAQNKML